MKKALLLLLALGGCARGCERPVPVRPQAVVVTTEDAAQLPEPATDTFLRAPHVARLDLARHDDEPAWHGAAWTGPFREPGQPAPARPYSNARILWTDEALLLSLYAADQDVRSLPSQPSRTDADFFEVRIHAQEQDFALRLGPQGVVQAHRAGQPWQPDVALSLDVDGSLDDASGEDDEEWVVFAAIPWSDLGLHAKAGLRLGLEFGRCDTPKDGARRCGQWGEGMAGVVELGR